MPGLCCLLRVTQRKHQRLGSAKEQKELNTYIQPSNRQSEQLATVEKAAH